ncbi:unnamed protein product [Spirodela intermedia]|uniref:Uncharacterized protein n=1 Tax=Spirodela intermedia TaxID=51605 RepID=A0A7I8J6M3_SPIIN|nr:unnamed protein product [Spirodela intermedia]CAA6665886.1 unnamed protein product [Spirodela intermedia]
MKRWIKALVHSEEGLKRVAELERRESESKVELFSRNEEKREAIRQLCRLIEYHRENCDHACKLLSASLNRRRRRS